MGKGKPYDWKKQYSKLKKNNGMDAVAPGNQASAELCKSMGWEPPTKKLLRKKKN